MKFYGQFDPPVDEFIYERYFIGRQSPGVAIECGAFDGLTESSCKFFEESLGWACVNVEPYPPAFAKLVVNRPLSTNINVALSSSTSTVEFTAVIHPSFGEDCNNGSIQHTAHHRQALDGIGCTYRQYRVATTTYHDLVLAQQLMEVDLFVLDVEGHEHEVLEGMRQTPRPLLPKILCVEHGHLGVEELKPAIQALGYTFDTTSFVNSFYLRNDVAAVFLLLGTTDRTLLWRISELEGALLRCQADKALVEANLALLTNSRSWKAMAPLRWLMTQLRKI
jgi:FkbM family methyltransferase